MPTPTPDNPYFIAFRGSFTSALRWHHLDALWQVLKQQPGDDWYLYAIGEPPPQQPSGRDQLHHFIEEIDTLLRSEHDHDYCGIVYADNLQQPTFIKIYDPNNLGVSCGYSDNPPLPGWVLSKLPPSELGAERSTKSRQRWWQRVVAGWKE